MHLKRVRPTNRNAVRIAVAAVLLTLVLAAVYFIAHARGEVVVVYRASPGEYASLSAVLSYLELVSEDGESRTLLWRDLHLSLSATSSESLVQLSHRGVPAGRYTGIRLALSEPRTATGEPLARVASEFLIPIELTVERGNTSAIVLTFQPQYSVYAQDGMDVFVPVIGVETRRNADDSTGDISGGTIETNATFGTAFTGEVKRNFRQVR